MQGSTINISAITQTGEELRDLRKSYIQYLYTDTEKVLDNVRTAVQIATIKDMSIKNINSVIICISWHLVSNHEMGILALDNTIMDVVERS